MRPKLVVVLLALALMAAACGDSADSLDSSSTTTPDSSAEPPLDEMSEGMDPAMGEMNMGDVTAVRADDVAGAEVVTADFVLLDSRPPGYEEAAGAAWLARHELGTTLTIELTGLVPEASYIAHLHEGGCAEAGGDHFKFDPNGSDVPPNEIHLAFGADSAGVGFMTAENHATAGDRARSVVVHPSDLLDNKLACAEF